MTRQRRLKERARAYMRATGTTYSAARARVEAGIERTQGGTPEKGKTTPMSDRSSSSTGQVSAALVVGVRPFFIVTSMYAAVDYYRDRLGFELDFVAGDYFAIVRREGAGIHLKEVGEDVGPLPNPQRHAGARHDGFISVVDPDSLYEELTDRRATMHRELEDTEDGLRAFEVRDLDGYVLCFGRPR